MIPGSGLLLAEVRPGGLVTRRQLAAAAGVHPGTVRSWERAAHPRPRTVGRYPAACDACVGRRVARTCVAEAVSELVAGQGALLRDADRVLDAPGGAA